MPLKVNGWTLLFHPAATEQIKNLADALNRARKADPDDFRSNANVKLLGSIYAIVTQEIPANPGHEAFLLGNTMGPSYRHWRRVKFNARFRLFFRYHSVKKLVVIVWVNDQNSLRKAGDKNDPYSKFKAMLDRGNPPDDWEELFHASTDLPENVLDAMRNADDA